MDRNVFKVIRPRVGRPAAEGDQFVLQQDNWNDYGFSTQYQLFFYRQSKPGKTEEDFIGSVKILRRGQTSSDPLQITADFETLGQEFCSVGESLDYYERLSKLGRQIRVQVLEALHDVIQNPRLVSDFASEPGWGKSLFRDQLDEGKEFRTLASSLMTGDYTSLPSDDLQFSFQISGWEQPAVFAFKGPPVKTADWFAGESILPERIAVIVGRNGSGKSTLLARLARVAFGTVGDRSKSPLNDLGALEPVGIGFPRIVNITFSPFDSFRLPGSNPRNRKQVVKEVDLGAGRFVFIGLRDIAKERSSPPIKGASTESAEAGYLADRLGQTRLKSIDHLATEFESFLKKIGEKQRIRLLDGVLSELVLDSPFAGLGYFDGDDMPAVHAKAAFLQSSTGHKIVLLIASGLIAHIEPRSLVLIDEPETHLHPPLLAALMHALRRILSAHQAFAIVATHSAVVVQESLAQHVKVVRREGKVTQFVPVRIETFGEGLGLISGEVFGLQSDATDFHKVLDQLVERVGNLEGIEALFQDGVMSHQARAYVMSMLAASKKA
jgi:energy-coupling factor transporter ATP-binding protein EcfA2